MKQRIFKFCQWPCSAGPFDLTCHHFDMTDISNAAVLLYFTLSVPRGDFLGAQMGGAPFKNYFPFGELSPPKNSCIGLAFHGLLALLPKFFALL